MTENIVKTIGAVSVVGAAFFYGRIMVRELRRKIKLLSSFLEFVIFISENIEYFLKPIPDIIAEYRGEYLVECGFIKEAVERGLDCAWSKISASVGGEAKEILHGYFTAVGSGYADEEKRLSEYTIERLGRILESERAAVADREKIYRTVPVMLAASVVLIIF